MSLPWSYMKLLVLLDYQGNLLNEISECELPQSLKDKVDASIDKVVHVLIKCLFKLTHISSLARLSQLDILIELVFLQQSFAWEHK